MFISISVSAHLAWKNVFLVQRYCVDKTMARRRKKDVGFEKCNWIILHHYSWPTMKSELIAKRAKNHRKNCWRIVKRQRAKRGFVKGTERRKRKTHFPSIIEWCCVDWMNNVWATKNEIICWYSKKKNFLIRKRKEIFTETNFFFIFFFLFSNRFRTDRKKREIDVCGPPN